MLSADSKLPEQADEFGNTRVAMQTLPKVSRPTTELPNQEQPHLVVSEEAADGPFESESHLVDREPSVPRSLSPQLETDFNWQTEMDYESEFNSEIDNCESTLTNVLAALDEVGHPSKVRRAAYAESVRSVASSFCRSRTASVRLAAERLAASQRRANTANTPRSDMMTTAARLIKVGRQLFELSYPLYPFRRGEFVL